MIRHLWSRFVRDCFTSAHRRRSMLPVVGIERLEVRSLMSADTNVLFGPMAADVGIATVREAQLTGSQNTRELFPLTAIPQLHSNTGAAATLFLDFNGHFQDAWSTYRNVQSPVFSLDADRSTFSGWELATIHEILAQVAEDFTPFNLDVTTVEPPSFADRVAQRIVIGGATQDWWAGCGSGVSLPGSFSNSQANTAYVFSESFGLSLSIARGIAFVAAHEAGHAFGLEHQSQYGADGSYLCIRPPVDGVGGIMATGELTDRVTWSIGTTTSRTTIQDDVAVLAGSQNGFGFRADDHGNTQATATPLIAVGNRFAATGVISQANDVDAFSFTSNGGLATFNVLTARLDGNLQASVELRDASGSLLASATATKLAPAGLTAELPAGTYSVLVKSNGLYDSLGNYLLSGSVVSNSTAPLASVSNLQVNVGWGNRYQLQWDEVSGAAGYRVFQGPPNANSVPLATLPAGVTHFTRLVVIGQEPASPYRIEAFRGSQVSQSALVGPRLEFPQVTNNVRFNPESIGTDSVTLSWTPDPNAVAQRVVVTELVQELSFQYVSTVTVDAHQGRITLTGLKPGARYGVMVHGYNEGGGDPASYEVTLPSLNGPPATVISELTVRPGRQVDVAWQPVPNATGYRVYFEDAHGTHWAGRFDATQLRTTLNQLVLNGTYRVHVDAITPTGTSRATSDSFVVTPFRPTAPSAFTAVADSQRSVQLTWGDSDRETEYRVYRISGSTTIYQANLAAGTTQYRVTNLQPGQQYLFRVDAVNADGATSSSTISVTTPNLNPPTAPTQFTATAVSARSVQLTWGDSDRETEYRVYRISGSTTVYQANLAAGTTQYFVTNLQPSQQYSFRVDAVNADGVTSSSLVTVRTPEAPPSTPTGLRTTNVGQTFAALSWTDVTQETGYRVYQTTAGVEQLVATLAANTTQYTVNGLVKETTYRLRVAAFNAGGETSSALSVTTLAELPPPIRYFTAVAAGSSEVQLNWNDTTGETRYSVYQSTGTAGSTVIANLAANSTNFRVSGLLPRTTYRFFVLASNTGGNVSTSWVTVTTL